MPPTTEATAAAWAAGNISLPNHAAAIGLDQHQHHAGRHHGADDAADHLAVPLGLGIGVEDAAGLEIVHHVAGQTRRNRHDAGHEHSLCNLQIAGHLGDGHDKDAEDLHGVNAGLTHALRGHGGGQPHAQQG